MRAFDRKFGPDLVARLPSSPGVYQVLDPSARVIYVGKAKNLRRRILQYRNAKRRKKHQKMREIVRDADRIEWQVCASELEACLLETRLIQRLRPKWNVAGAFHFMYPLVGSKVDLGKVTFCYTTEPERFQGFSLHGAFRSRQTTREAFGALMRLLMHVGHRLPGRPDRLRSSLVCSFTSLPSDWVECLERYWRGESREAIEDLVIALAESRSARRNGTWVQEQLDALRRFWKHEAVPLARARARTGFVAYPVAQADRDALFLRFRMGAKAREPGTLSAGAGIPLENELT